MHNIIYPHVGVSSTTEIRDIGMGFPFFKKDTVGRVSLPLTSHSRRMEDESRFRSLVTSGSSSVSKFNFIGPVSMSVCACVWGEDGCVSECVSILPACLSPSLQLPLFLSATI